MGAIFWIPISIIAVAALALHAVAVFMSGAKSAACSYVNVALHIFALLFLLYHKVELDVALLFFMTSVLIYLVMSFVRFKLLKKCERGEDDDV